MKLTKKLQKEIEALMIDYWASYLDGNINHWQNYLVDDYRNIGGTEEEIWNSKKEILDYTDRMMDQMKGLTELRNKQLQIIPYDPYFMVHELLDVYIKVEDQWTFYQKFRLSSLIQKIDNEWKVLHQHGSYPDAKTGEGEAFAVDEIKVENRKLKDAIKRRTVQLEEKNRDLEIEAALERVRARTMAMQNSRELADTASVLFKQIKGLGFETWSCGFCTWQENDTVEVWMGADSGGLLPPMMIPYKKEPTHHDIYQASRTGAESHEKIWEGKALKKHYDFLHMLPSVATAIKQLEDAGLSLPAKQCYYVGFFKQGYLLLITKEPNGEMQDISKRFAKVFEQAYTRFLDLQKAEAQAREAKIEAAVESVRAQSMAMYKTSDLYKVNQEILSQLNKLKVDGLTGVSIYLVDENDIVTVWDLSSPGNISNPNSYSIKYDSKKFPIMGGFVEKWKTSDDDYFVLDFPKELLIGIAKEFEEILPEMAVHFKNAIESGQLQHQWNPAGRLSDGILSIDLTVPPTEDTKSIVTKMAGAFNLAYQRFLDLQKAEAQSREAQIELALERVRARTMAMQKSEELAETSYLLFQQLKELGASADQLSIGILNEAGQTMDLSVTLHGSQLQKTYTVKLDEPFVVSKSYAAWKANKKSIVITLTGKDLEDYNAYRNSLSKIKFNKTDADKKWVVNCAFFSKGWMSFSSLENVPAETIKLLERFTAVFDGTYTRFLDLQKAEAQAREAKIEAAVERVRADAMAMHSTSDFEKVVKQLLQQIQHLNLEGFTGAQIILIDEKEFLTVWDCSSPGNIGDPKSATIRYEAKKFPIMGVEILNKWKEGKPYFVMDFDLKTLRAAVKEWKKINLNIASIINDAISGGHLTHQWDACGRLHNGMIAFDMIKPPDEDVRNITIKMTHAFEQAYTRFLDLQRAEAQSREAQIELALERVRARTMAMQHSDELADASFLLDQQVKALGIKTWGCAFNIYGEKESTEWFSNEMGTMQTYKTPREKVFLDYYKAGQKGETLLIKEFSGKECVDWYNYLCTLPGIGDGLNRLKAAGGSFPTHQIDHVSFFKYGYLLFISFEPVPEAHEIFKRFATVFEQTYTRFLDLQKAEASVREAKIEAALEKVRSRSLAMHTSNELNEVVSVLFEKIKELQIPATAVGIAINIEGSKDLDAFVCGENENGLVITNYRLAYFKNKISNDLYNALTKQLDFFVGRYSKKEKDAFYEYLFEHTAEFKDLPEDILKMIFESQSYTITMVAVKNAVFNINDFDGKILAEKDVDIIKRFAKVFQQAYTRFLDLQIAETQVREAQINLAVERVRARALAMFKSEEILEVVVKLKEEIMSLDIPGVAAATIHLKEKNGMHRMWDLTSLEYDGESLHLPLDISYKLKDTDPGLYIRKVWKNREQYFLVKQDRKDLKITTAWLRSNGKFKEADEGDQFLDSIDFTFFYHPTIQLNNGRMSIDLLDHLPPPEMESILMKMGAAFDLAYKRFEDLKNSEAQLREAEVELALERVRSQAMAMQKSSDLLDIVVTMRNEFTRLGHEAHYFWHMMWLPEKYEKAMTSGDGTKIGFVMELPRHIHGNIPLLAKWEKSKKPTVVHAMNVEEALDYVDKMISLGDFQHIDPQAPSHDDIRHINGLTFVMARTTHGEIGYSLPGVVENPPKEDLDILIRFAGAFDIAHRRFLDLQKSEAQAREVEIELALEKVRSRSMGMQKSVELKEAIKIVYQQLTQLKINLDHAGFVVNYIPKGDWHFWIADEQDIPAEITHPYFESVWANQFNEAKEKRTDFFVTNLNFEEKNKFYKELLSYVPGLPEASKDFYLNCPGLAASTVLFDDVSLYIENFKGIPYTNEENNILLRFGKVFQQTYTRFLDLQKAEAQAREAQIELGLERVRARAMAMQKSDELSELVDTVFKELTKLDFALSWCMINIVDQPSMSNTVWGANPEIGKTPESYHMLFEDYRFHHEMFKAWEEKQAKWTIVLEGKEKEIYDEYLFNQTEFRRVPEPVQQQMRATKKYEGSFTFSNFGGLQTIGEEPLSEANMDILARFGKVFDLTYTRFNDLQKAEAQAREAQIEGALERVRSQSMGMQTSKDLSNVTTAMFEQLRILGGELYATGIVFCDKYEGHVEQWHSVPGAGMLSPFIVPIDLDYIHQYRYDQWKKGVELFSVEIPEDFIAQHFDTMFKLPTVKAVFDDFAAKNIPMPETPSWEIDYGASFKNGYILVSALQPFSEAAILPRFAKVFEQTYTRFLDLQKAEAQAKEARIEAALERTRTQSMIMQHSNELDDTLRVFHEQVQLLGINSAFSYLWLPDEEKEKHIFWAIWEEGNNDAIVFKNKAINYPLDRNEPATKQCLIDWKSDENVFSYAVTPQGVENYFAAWAALFEGTEKFKPENFSSGLYYVEAFMKYGCFGVMVETDLSEDEKKLLGRFAVEFERTYTRFLDLQKAEASAKEARIEGALEKVRSRSLAMHNADELSEVVAVIVEKLTELDVVLDANGVVLCTYFPNSKNVLHWIVSPDFSMAGSYLVPYFDHPIFNDAWNSKIAGDEYFSKAFSVEEKNSFFEYAFAHSDYKNFPDEFKQWVFQNDKHILSFAWQQNSAILIPSHTGVLPNEAEKAILIRFAKVFEQTYTRFLDLQKAEAQAREAKIEAALEKVRSRSMAMHHSENLHEVINALTEQLQLLGFYFDTANFITNYTKDGLYMWVSTPGVPVPSRIYITLADLTFSNILNDALKDNLDFISYTLSLEEKNDFFRHFFENTDGKYIPEERKQYIYNSPGLSASVVLLKNVFLTLANYQTIPYTEDENAIIRRFGNVFGQSYSRFLDLQKAEAQAREAMIEAALERVRSRSMAMYKSNEVMDVAVTLYNQLQKLDFKFGAATIIIMDKNTGTMEHWLAGFIQQNHIDSYQVNNIKHPLHAAQLQAWREGAKFVTMELAGPALESYAKEMFTETGYKNLPDEEKEMLSARDHSVFNLAYMSHGALMWAPSALSDEKANILQRFAKVFEQTYTRFLDLQKAEVQAREAKIEAALEKVRSRSMAMQTSDELREAGDLLCNEIQKLGIETITSGYVIMDDEENIGWNYAPNPATGKIMEVAVGVPHNETEIMRSIKAAWKKQKPVFVVEMNEAETIAHQTFIAEQSINFPINAEQLIAASPPKLKLHNFNFKQGYLIIVGGTRLRDEQEDMMLRFTKVFQQTYRRFLDLKKAEAQAREARIEASLERVRSKTMAMHNSHDVGDTVATMFAEFVNLGIYTNRCGILIFGNKDSAEVWTARSNPEGNATLIIGKLDLNSHKLLSSVYEAWKAKESFYQYDLLDNDLKRYYEAINKSEYYSIKFDIQLLPSKEFHSDFFFAEGAVFAFTDEPVSKENSKIIKRFAGVFGQTHRRYLDLQKAEAQARESQIETGLERVRSRTLAMQKSDELADTSIVIFEQLINLGIEPNRLFIGIINNETAFIEAWATNEDGTKIDNHFTLNTDKNVSVKKMYEGWKNKKTSITIDMQGEELQHYFNYLADEMHIPFQGGLSQKRRVQTIAYFGQGLIGMASPEEQPAATTQLLERFAAVFNLTYTRFNDLKIAEAQAIRAEQDLVEITNAKQTAEAALVELQATQKQLIQSEKMASLGELTAGIAHEIQNPLNFVNNFSEVSKELLEEMKEAIAKGNIEESNEIMQDIIQNLEKINHHGRRADAIVKGMLQHSNSASSSRELTDINALADEYLRLSYHGLRAKNKSFNATMKTDFDESIGKINIIPQDIGRVILNLINNAFYAAPLPPEGGFSHLNYKHEPTVWVSTKREGDKVLISVRDNGPGIPQKILDKIFQPFFTTKPTGQGTGLGLSLSYDIIKAHGGELKVETKEGEGAEFVIQLPLI